MEIADLNAENILNTINCRPTTSRNENLSESYYQAVRDGELGLCASYNTRCPKGIFEFITQFA